MKRIHRYSESLRHYGVRAFLVAWAALLSLVGASLMVGHWVVLPKPSRTDPVLVGAVAELGAQQWSMIHVLDAACPCSQRVFGYLFDRGPVADTNETIVLVGDAPDVRGKAEAARFRVENVTREQLEARFNIVSAPLVLISDPAGTIRYSGGYTGRKQGLDYQDVALLNELRGGTDVEDLPLYGCGVSQELQAQLDPIGVKYGTGMELP